MKGYEEPTFSSTTAGDDRREDQRLKQDRCVNEKTRQPEGCRVGCAIKRLA
jgi:hypothetical protein